MATNTSYLGLTKPAQSDLYNVDVFNDNADKVDANAQKTAANLATIESVATASKPYVVGEYLVLNGILYKVTQAIANGGALVVGTNIAQDSVGTELKSLKDALSNLLTVTTETITGTIPTNTYYQLIDVTPTKSGYTPLGLVGFELGSIAYDGYAVFNTATNLRGVVYTPTRTNPTSAVSVTVRAKVLWIKNT